MSNLEALIQAAQYLEENDRELVLQWDLLLGILNAAGDRPSRNRQ